MTDRETLNALRLIRTSQIGPVTYSMLIARYGIASDAISAVPQLAKRHGRPLKICSIAEAEAIISQSEAVGATMICKGAQAYPKRLMAFDDAPVILFAKGHLSLLQKEMIAIVGARNASLNGMNLTAQWAKELGKAGFVILSGLAKGIDRASHIGSLPTGSITISGCGIDVVYPRENSDLYELMIQSGLIVTEYPPGTAPSPRHFPARNRIIASLAKGILVTEAVIQSGSLITAREGAERGAEIMAIPGSPTDPRALGANQLIKDGAHLISKTEDILKIMQSPLSEPRYYKPAFQPNDLAKIDDEMIQKLAHEIMKIITIEPVDIDELVRQCHVSANVIQIALLELELAGRISRLSGNRVCKLINYE